MFKIANMKMNLSKNTVLFYFLSFCFNFQMIFFAACANQQ